MIRFCRNPAKESATAFCMRALASRRRPLRSTGSWVVLSVRQLLVGGDVGMVTVGGGLVVMATVVVVTVVGGTVGGRVVEGGEKTVGGVAVTEGGMVTAVPVEEMVA